MHAWLSISKAEQMHLSIPTIELRVIGRLAAEIKDEILAHFVPAPETIIKIDARAWAIECNVPMQTRARGLGLKEEGVLLGEKAHFGDQVEAKLASPGLVARAAVEAHARHRRAVGEAPLRDHGFANREELGASHYRASIVTREEDGVGIE